MRINAANCALDMKEHWIVEDVPAIALACRTCCSLRLSVDGAKRGNGESSGAMASIAYPADGSSIVLYRAGVCFGRLDLSFLAELMAMEWGLDTSSDI